MSANAIKVQHAGPIPAPHRRVAIGAFITEFAYAIPMVGLAFFTPAILHSFPEFKSGELLVYYTLFGIASALAMPVTARLVDHVKVQYLLVIGGIIASLGLAIFGLSASLWMFYLAGVVLGIGFGMSVQYVPIVVINRWFSAKRGTILGAVLTGSGFGGVLLGLFTINLIQSLGWRTTIFAYAIAFALLTVLPALFFIRSNPEDVDEDPYGAAVTPLEQFTSKSGDEPGLPEKSAYSSPWFYLLIGSYLLFGITYGMIQHFVNYLSGDDVRFDVGEAQISAVSIVATICLILFKPLIGNVVDKIGLELGLWITLGIAAIATAVSGYLTAFIPYLIAMVFISLGTANGTVTPPLVAEHAFGQKNFSKLWGVLGMAYPIGLAIGAPIWGWINDYLGSYVIGFTLVPVTTVIFLLGYHFTFRGTRKKWVPEEKEARKGSSDSAAEADKTEKASK